MTDTSVFKKSGTPMTDTGVPLITDAGVHFLTFLRYLP